jgi:hypothetical protein
MNEQYQEIYNYFKANKLTDLDANSFYKSYSDPSKSKELWSYLKQNNMTDLDANAFHSSYFGVKKKEVSQSTLDQSNTSSARLSNTTTKPTASSSLKGDGVYRIPGQPEGVFYKKEGNDWYKKQYGVFDYKKITDPTRIKKFESNTVPYEPKEKEEIYILPDNPGALYKRDGKHWSKKVGQNYIPIKLGDVSAREEILNQQAVVATKFDLDRIADYAPEVDQQLQATPIENKELKKSFEEKYGDIKVLENQMELKRQEELKKPVPQEEKNFNWRIAAGKILSEEAYKDISPAFYMDYYDSDGNPIDIMDADKMKVAETNMKKDFGEIEFKAYHSVSKIPSRDKLSSLEGDNAAKLLNNQFKGTNIRFYQDGSEIRIVSNLGSGINKEILNEKTLDLSSPEFDKYIKSFVASNILRKSEKDKFNNVSTIDDLVELVGTQPYKFSPSLLEGIDVDSYYQNKRKLLEGELVRSKANSYEQDSKTFDKEIQEFNTQIKGGKMSNQEFDKRSAELEAKRKELESRRRVISNTVNEAEKIDKITNNLYKANIIDQEKKEKEGSFIGLIGRQFGQGLSNVSKMGVDFAAAAGSLFTDAETFANAVSPGSYQELKNLGYSDEEIKNETQKIIKSTGNKIIKDVPDVFGAGTTEEYAKSKDRGQIEQAVSALAESIGTMAGGAALAPGSKLAQDAAFFAMAYNSMEDQMRGPAFDGLSENEKKIISLPYGLIIGQLEKFGAKVGLSAADSPILNAFSKYVMSKVFTSLPKNASLLEIKTAIDKSVAASVANGMIKIVGAGFVEGGTEFTQQIFEGVEKDVANKIIQSNQLEAAGEKYDGKIPKEIVDQIKENSFFKDVSDLTTSEGISQLLSQSADAFNLGFLAGGIGGTISVGIKDPISNKISNNRFKIYKDLVSNDEARNGFIASINAKVESGKLTRVEANQQIKSIEDSYPVIMRIPDNLSTSAQREAFSLIAEKDALERDIIGKDPALVAKQKDRITEINEQLKTTSYAVQEQTTSEVSVQPGAEVGGEVAQGESQAGSQVIAEEGQKEVEATPSTQAEVTEEQKKSVEKELNEIITPFKEGLDRANENNDPDTAKFYQDALNEFDSDPVSFIEKMIDSPATSSKERALYQTALDGLTKTQETIIAEPSEQLATVEADQVATYRAEEQAELLKAIPKIESYKVNGEIDKTLMPKTVLAKYNKIYNKYDKLISPLLETTAQINVAPLFNTKVTNIEEAKAIQDSDQYKQYKEKIGTVAIDFGIKVDSIEDSIGGYAGVSEVSNIVNVTGDWNSIVEFAAVFGAMTPEVQDSTIAGRTIESGSEFHNTDRYEVELDNQEAAMKAAAAAGFDQEGFTLTGNKIMFFNIFEYPVEDFDNKYITFVNKYTEYGGKIGSETKSAIQSEFIDSDRRAEIITKIEGDAVQQTGREGIRNAIQEAKPRNEEYIRRKKQPAPEMGATAVELAPKENILPQKVQDRLTDDGKGNYVFHHYSFEKRDKIKPTSGEASLIVSKEEASAISSVGGVGQYYTMQNQVEPGVGPILHTVLVPKEEVYYLQEDKLGLYDKAKEEFQKARPGQAFSPNYQAAWIGKVANDLGYKILVSEWRNGELRGQTTLELKPEEKNIDFSPRKEEVYQVGDKVNISGEDAVITDIKNNIITFKGEKSSGSINLARSKNLIRKVYQESNVNELLTADTKEESNLEKVLNTLDKIEGDLDQFGKETLGVNIPVVLAKAIVQAVKALVKAGITLEQAIKQVAAENGLNNADIKSLFNPTKVSEIDVNEVRSKSRPGKRVSKGLSVKTVDGKKVIEETEDLSLEYVKQNAPSVFVSNANIIAKYPLVAGKQKFRKATTVEQAQKIYDVFVREVADNLKYLMDEFKPEFREISTLWYDGANALANDFAQQFGVSPEQAAGIIAAMSPQKDWYQNVRLAEMVMMAYKDNPVMTQKMIDYQKGVNKKSLYDGAKSAGKKLKKAEKEYSESRTKLNREALEEAKVKMQEGIEKSDALIAMLEKYLGQNLKDVPADVQPYMVRTYHEVNTTKDYNIVAPDGSVQGVAKKKKGGNAKVAWGSYSEIGKAVAIYNDGSQENITRSLGEMHKIRNFYNNIIDPMSADGDVTMDTHAIAAALLLPLSGKSTQVGQNFGTKTSNSGPLGIKGLYYAYADAYALAAKESGLLPRQIQSITWEAVRGLYTDTFKGNKEKVAQINNIWKNYQDGKITINEAREQAKQAAGGIQDPTWAGGPLQDESGASVQEEGVGSGSEGDGRDILGGELGGEILTADTKNPTVLRKVESALNKVDNDLAKFGRETLGINIPVATMRAIIKLAKVLVKTGITLQEAIIKAAEQLNVSKEDALNAVKFMADTIKSPVKKILVNEAAALRDQLRLEARAARAAKTDLNTKRKQIAAFIRSLETKGTITARQAAALVKRVSSLNLDNETMVERFEQYAEKVFKRAEYQDLLTSAFRVRRLIRKAIKSENQAEVVGMAKLFSKIDPSLVDDIDNYIALAESVLNAVRPSKQNVKDPALRQAANIEAIAEYANEQIAKQEENRKRELMAEYKYLVDSGVLTNDLSVKEMQEIINLIDNPTAEFDPEADQKKLNFLQNRLASMEAVFRYMLANNINPFTGEDVVIDPKDADLIKRLLKMDLAEMSVRDAAKVVEAMDNYLMNNITSGLEAAVRSYEGAQNAKQLVAQGKKARPLKSYFNKTIGRLFGEQLISLPLLFEKMFPGIKNAANIMQKMGLVDVINGSNKAIRQHNDLMTEYSKQDFYKEKGFMEAKNVYERGMLAFLKRNLIGTKTEIRDEFKRRADIISQSIEALRENGTDKEKQMADLYQEVYDKLGVSELDIDVIEANADQMNKDATDWMINEWGKIYGELADVSLSVYNSMLGSDTNYTPDRYKKLSAEDQAIDDDILKSGSGFMMSMDYTDKNKTGVLMETTRPKALPKNEERRTTRYISLDFDVNNFNSLKGALVDINTAGAIRQVDGFARSRAFNKLVPEAKDRALLTRRINTYIQRVKGKRTASTDTIKDVERLANFVTGLGVGKALAGLDQPIKQTVPVMINTFINSNGNMTFVNPDMNEAINRSGMPIANRGLESQTAVESIDRLLDKTGGKGAEFIKKIEDLNQFWLKTLLAKPDVWVARSSFITYYLKDMRSKGENVKDIDWSTHEWNKDSAQYAQIMVDRQQNISDDKLAGDFLSSDDPTKRITRKVIMPFATFIMNQKARMHNDFLAWRSKDSSKEDKRSAVKSLIGLGAELAAYQLIAYGIKTLVYDSIANALVGDDEEEKKDKSLFGLKMTTKQFNATKFPVKSIVGDILSPLPFLDDIVVMGFDRLMEEFPQISNEDINKAVEEKNAILRFKGEEEMDDKTKTKFIEQLKSDNIYSVAFKNDGQSGRSYGMIGIAYDTYKELIDLSAMAYTGEFEDEYQGRVTKKYLPEENRKILQNISVPLMILYSSGIAPKDLGTVARKVTNIVKRKGVTENQHEKEKEVKKQINRDLNEWEFELVKTRKKANGVVDEINYVESKGGLDNKQGKEYVKLIEAIPTPSDDMLRDIQKGMTAEQIIKRSTE